MKRSSTSDSSPRRKQIPRSATSARSPDHVFVPPYPPSWVDRFMAWVQRLPFPYGLTYLALFLLQLLVMHVLQWIDGTLQPFHLHQSNLLFPVWLWGPLAMMTYLDEVAERALREFQPLLGKHQDEIPRLQYELKTLPPRSVWISSLLWTGLLVALMVVALPAVVRQYHYGPLAITAAWVFGLMSYGIGSVVYYHTVRQLRIVSRILRMAERVNLFQLDPLYAFTRLTTQTSICWLLLAGTSFFTFPLEFFNVLVLSQYVFQVLLALGSLVLPVWNVHQRLVSEKRRLLAGVNRRLENAIERLHEALDVDDLARVKEVDTALGGLSSERGVLSAIPTWPWRTETLRWTVPALVLPVVIRLVQLGLERLLG